MRGFELWGHYCFSERLPSRPGKLFAFDHPLPGDYGANLNTAIVSAEVGTLGRRLESKVGTHFENSVILCI